MEFPLADLVLARRLERAEALSNIAFVEARARLTPELGATWHEVDGTCAMFDGIGSPCTQTFGLGIAAPVRPEGLSELEDFFQSRHAPVYHEVSPQADGSVLALLPGRGYRPIEMSSVMYRPISGQRPATTSRLEARRVRPGEGELWGRIAAEGWQDFPAVAHMVEELGRVIAVTRGTECFLVESEGRAIAAGAISVREGVALMAGASTIPEWRGRGAQTALFTARLEFAASQGADLAMICNQPGSASQRNAERQGFRIAYTRTKWQLETGERRA